MYNYEIENPVTKRVYKRISKATAKKLFNSGNCIVVAPCKLRPFGPWHPECIIDGFMEDDPDRTFDKIINAFIWYNCNYETGYYPSFYVLKSL